MNAATRVRQAPVIAMTSSNPTHPTATFGDTPWLEQITTYQEAKQLIFNVSKPNICHFDFIKTLNEGKSIVSQLRMEVICLNV
jgi:hypothetical protein